MSWNDRLTVPTSKSVGLLRDLAIDQPEFLLEQSYSSIKESLPEWEEIDLEVSNDSSTVLSMPTEATSMDASNAVKIFNEALPGLPPALATDERLWVGLSFGVFRDYVRARFPEEKRSASSATSFIENHYLCGGRNYKRSNAIARLWWLGEVSAVNGESDFSIAGYLVSRQEIFSDLISRPKLFTSRHVRLAVLAGTKAFFEESGIEWDKSLYRAAMVELDLLAGRKLLSTYSDQNLAEETRKIFERVNTRRR